MSVLKVIEIISDSTVSWKDAAKQAITKASKTLPDVKSIYIKDQSAKAKDGKTNTYRVNAKVNFMLD